MMMHGMCRNCCPVHKTAWILVMIGAINWGLIGLGGFLGSNWNLLNILLGNWPQVEWIVYILVGVSAIMMLMKGKCKMCMQAGEMCDNKMMGEKMMGEKKM